MWMGGRFVKLVTAFNFCCAAYLHVYALETPRHLHADYDFLFHILYEK